MYRKGERGHVVEYTCGITQYLRLIVESMLLAITEGDLAFFFFLFPGLAFVLANIDGHCSFFHEGIVCNSQVSVSFE